MPNFVMKHISQLFQNFVFLFHQELYLKSLKEKEMVEVYWITKDQIFYKIVLEPLVNMLRILKVQGD